MATMIKEGTDQKKITMTLVAEVLKDSPNQTLINDLLLALDIPVSKDPMEQLEHIYKHVESSSFKKLLQKEV
ncbi:MAG TPA: hypothetical protein PLJ21_00055 [Pseudobdellovibrionaceae bacterium]|nr:hypothetical protein [Pseudobdellovibrionaceae bacterium]